jgi:hypothetical protein
VAKTLYPAIKYTTNSKKDFLRCKNQPKDELKCRRFSSKIITWLTGAAWSSPWATLDTKRDAWRGGMRGGKMSGARDESWGGRMDGKWGKWAWMSGKGCGTAGFPEAAFQAPKKFWIIREVMKSKAVLCFI